MSRTEEKPEWASWIEHSRLSSMVTGVRCRVCGANRDTYIPKDPGRMGRVWIFIDHDEDCQHR